MLKLWNETSWEEYVEWQHQDDKIVERINLLLKDIDRNGAAKGIGKPEKNTVAVGQDELRANTD